MIIKCHEPQVLTLGLGAVVPRPRGPRWKADHSTWRVSRLRSQHSHQPGQRLSLREGNDLAAGAASADDAQCVGDDSRHVMVAPSADEAAHDEASILLLLLPGAYMTPANFEGVVTRLREELAGLVKLWVAIAQPIWQEVDVKAPDAMQQAGARVAGCLEVLLARAQQQGFPAEKLPSGRCNNMFILAHSSAALFAVPLAARKVGALILLGSYMFPSADYHASLAEWSRPVMHLGGRLDGQARFSRLTFAALDAAACASKFGDRYAALNKPVILLPGVNHAQLSNGVLKDGSFDLAPAAALADATDAVAGALADFITVHSSDDRASREDAAARLSIECASTFEWLSPFAQALGRGALGQKIAKVKQRTLPGRLHVPLTQAIHSARGAENLPDSDTSRRFIAHPGELSLAEAFANTVQTRIAGSAAEAAGVSEVEVKIISTVHTDIDMFVYSQPTVKCTNGVLWVHSHCYLHRPHLVPFGHRIPIAPQYLLKLKSAAAIALARGATVKEDAVTAQAVNMETHEAALGMLAEPERTLYTQRGKQLIFLPDRDVSQEVATPVAWVKGLPLEAVDTSEGRAEVCSPVVKTGAVPSGTGSAAAARFSGNLYMKCMSLAGAIEWVLCDSMRPHRGS